jgi:hypothetical protein
MDTHSSQDVANCLPVDPKPPGKLLHAGPDLMRRHELGHLVSVEALLSLLRWRPGGPWPGRTGQLQQRAKTSHLVRGVRISLLKVHQGRAVGCVRRSLLSDVAGASRSVGSLAGFAFYRSRWMWGSWIPALKRISGVSAASGDLPGPYGEASAWGGSHLAGCVACPWLDLWWP